MTAPAWLTLEQIEAELARADAEAAARAEQRRVELEARCRDSFAAFFRAGFHVSEGSRLLWGRHLQLQCEVAQAFAEGWLVAHGKGTIAMEARQRSYWALHDLDMPPGACGTRSTASAGAEDADAMPDPYELLVDHLVVNGGPGTLKSRIWMVYLQAWVWLHDPTAQFACTSGTEKNVIRDSNAAKALVSSAWYRDTFKVGWRVGVNSSGTRVDGVGWWVNSVGGDRVSQIWCSDWSGLHADFFFGDDPNDAKKVWSSAERDEVAETYDKAMGNRLKFGSVVMILQQHVHPQDQTMRLKLLGVPEHDKDAIKRARRCGAWAKEARKRWAAFVLPIEYDPDRPSSTPWGLNDWRGRRGEVLFEFQWTPDVIAAERERLGPAGWAAQGNQDPENSGTGSIDRAWFGFCVIAGDHPSGRARPKGCARRGEGGDDNLPIKEAVVIKKKPSGKLDLDWFEIHVDPKNGSQRKKSSRVGLVAVGGKGNQRFILDDRTERHGFLGTLDALREMIVDWAHLGLTAVVVEFKAQGEAVIATLKREIEQGKLIDRMGNKVVIAIEDAEGGSTPFEVRFNAALPAYRSGMVHVLDGAAWAEEHIEETCAVPNGAFDDRPDATCQAINRHAGSGDANSRFAALAKLKQFAQEAQRRSPYGR